MEDFCTHCRKETEFTLSKEPVLKKFKGSERTFTITTAICSECGEKMNPPGMIDKNVHEIKKQYETCKKISKGVYEYKGYRLYNCGYYEPDHCTIWEAVNIETGYTDFHYETKKGLKNLIDADEAEQSSNV